MKIQVTILGDNGEVLAEHEADACQPSIWRVTTGQKLLGKMPQISDQTNTGTYELFGITFQPHVRVDRPNGWVQPAPQPPSPVNGRPTTQNSFPSFPSSGVSAQKYPSQPTAGRAPGLRGY